MPHRLDRLNMNAIVQVPLSLYMKFVVLLTIWLWIVKLGAILSKI